MGRIREHFDYIFGYTFVGNPTDIERPTFDGVGRKQVFNGGVISWSPATDAWAVRENILVKWNSLGAEQWAYPITDETATPDGRGRYNDFRAHVGNEASIYWSLATGAWAIRGAIRASWISQGSERSPLGYPVSDEGTFNGVYGQRFERGMILWNGSVATTQLYTGKCSWIP